MKETLRRISGAIGKFDREHNGIINKTVTVGGVAALVAEFGLGVPWFFANVPHAVEEPMGKYNFLGGENSFGLTAADGSSMKLKVNLDQVMETLSKRGCEDIVVRKVEGRFLRSDQLWFSVSNRECVMNK